MRSWVEIDKENFKYNIGMIQKLSNGREVLGVIKANAYGLGALEIAKLLNECGIKFFGVATLDEALEIRNSGNNTEILILGTLFEDEIIAATENNFHINISTKDQLNFILNNNLSPKIHLKFDTGMGRLGFNYNDVKYIIEFCKKNNISIQGIFSHFSDSSADTENAKNYTSSQIEKFKQFEPYIDDIPFVHLFNSGGVVNHFDKTIGNMVRVGLSMYGFLGSNPIKDFKMVFTLKTRVLFMKTVEEDSSISYGREYILKKGETYAVLPLGYADGISKAIYKDGFVIIEDIKCPIIGKICMDMFMVKIPLEIKDKVHLGSEVIVLRDDIIKELNISSWDMLTGIGRRVKRIYV